MKKILVIEDDENVRLNIVKIVELEGFEALAAEHGQKGLQLAKEHVPDLILCDVLMPEMKGYEVLVEIRNDPLTTTIPFIFLTAKATKRDFRTGMGLGADDYLTKPFKIDDLLTAIRTQLKKHETVSKQMEDLRVNLSLMLPHEFRTPLSSIIGFSDFLRDPEMLPEPEEIAVMGQAIYESGLRLQRLVENYLLYANLKLMEIDSEKRKLWQDVMPVDTKDFITDFSIQFARKFQRQKDLVLDLVDTQIRVSGQALRKILEELLDNAFKFSRPDTLVQVMTMVNGSVFTLSVKDHGYGMTKEQMACIDAFIQFDRKKYEQQGLGLGLAIIRHLAELNNGEMSIESVLDQGTTIHVVFRQNPAESKTDQHI